MIRWVGCFRWFLKDRERSSCFCQASQKLPNKWLLRIPCRFKNKELNYFDIDGVHIFCNLPFFSVIFRILSNNKISELKNGSFSGLSLLERLWVFFKYLIIILLTAFFCLLWAFFEWNTILSCIFITSLFLNSWLFKIKIWSFPKILL